MLPILEASAKLGKTFCSFYGRMESRKKRFWDCPTFRRSKEADMKKLEYIRVKGRNFPTQPLRAKVNDTQWSQINNSIWKIPQIKAPKWKIVQLHGINNKPLSALTFFCDFPAKFCDFVTWYWTLSPDKRDLVFCNNFRMKFPILAYCVILWEGSTCCNTDIDTFFKASSSLQCSRAMIQYIWG